MSLRRPSGVLSSFSEVAALEVGLEEEELLVDLVIEDSMEGLVVVIE